MNQRKSMKRALSDQVYERDGYKCRQCDRTKADDPKLKFHIDHMPSVKDGGANTLDNLQVLCHNCNFAKAGELTPQALRELPNVEYEEVSRLQESLWNPNART